jgi:voltage-gated potassium channel
VQTVTTVGYGDVTPEKTIGRIIAVVVMLSGIGFLTVVTASITAVFIETARRRLSEETGRGVDITMEHIDERLRRIEQLLAERRERT